MSPLGVAMVTGAGARRIGWHVAKALADRGYSLILHYHTSTTGAAKNIEELRAAGANAHYVEADLTDERAVNALIDQALSHFGRIDVLVNCAADWRTKPFEDVTAADVRHYFDVNTLGTFLCSQKAGLVMVRQPTGGSIVTIGDWATVRPYVNYAAYFPSKGAIPALTRSLAVELGTRNPAVRVNCILPGPVMIPEGMPEEERNQAVEGTLVKREGRPEDVARAVLYLVENDFVTGVCLPVDGGRTIFSTDSL